MGCLSEYLLLYMISNKLMSSPPQKQQRCFEGRDEDIGSWHEVVGFKSVFARKFSVRVLSKEICIFADGRISKMYP
jgi:hypothetical protein